MSALAAKQAIRESILTDDIVTIDHTPEAFAYLKSVCGHYTVVSQGRQFDGGDECARNDWTVIVRNPDKADHPIYK